MQRKQNLNVIDQENPRLLSEIRSEDFAKLRERFEDSETVITICLPMEKAGAETRKNHIVFKNAISEAKERLAARSVENREIEQTLCGLQWLDDAAAEFWQQQEDGLIMFVDGGEDVVCIRLPYSIDSDVQIGNAPYLRPLHRLANPERFYVLALDLNELKLYESTRWNLRELEVENVPTSLSEAMKFDDPEESLQFRSGSRSSGKNGPDPIYHGQGAATDSEENKKIHRFFEMVSKDIETNFPERGIELILMGPGSERSCYREVNHYDKLSGHDIDLNPSNRSHSELERIVGKHIAEIEEKNLSGGIEKLEAQIANESGSVDLEEIVQALLSGKVDTFFYRSGAKKYGTVMPDTFEVEIHENPKVDDTELVGFCAEQAVRTGARVRVVESKDQALPEREIVAAAFRY